MGVKGLWSLLNPVARPVQLEAMEGKRLAIDSSIWLYQFQATMRDKDGRVLVNAHVLGFLRRINKLLFHGIKPVFVFDGGAPALKRATIADRKRKKMGAAANHAKMAEKLFAAQMRREAVKAAQELRDKQDARDAGEAARRYEDDAGEQIAEGAVYLEDLEGRPGPSRPRPTPAQSTSRQASATEIIPDAREERRKKFKKHDPYRLPETEMSIASTADKPDARLATEEELKQFIDDVHPEDIDVESPEFRALPTEVQYEIIGDLRVRSRQQSHKRLHDMLRAAPTALDFSMAQIKGLSQRNALTQQLLTVTDMVGKAHLTIPVRIASERNREYVLVKRGESEGGGWALGIREGTKANPIKVDVKEEEDDEVDSSEVETDDSDVEEVPAPRAPVIDKDLKEHRRREILEAIARRYAPAKSARPSLDLPVKSFGGARKAGAVPLFEDGDDDNDDGDIVPTAGDEALALALQQEELGSDEEEADLDLARALALSRKDAAVGRTRTRTASPDIDAVVPIEAAMSVDEESDDSFEEVSMVPSGQTTPLEPAVSKQTPIVVDSGDEGDSDFEEIAPPEPQRTEQPPARPSRNASLVHTLPALPSKDSTAKVSTMKALGAVDEALSHDTRPKIAENSSAMNGAFASVRSPKLPAPHSAASQRPEPSRPKDISSAPSIVGGKPSMLANSINGTSASSRRERSTDLAILPSPARPQAAATVVPAPVTAPIPFVSSPIDSLYGTTRSPSPDIEESRDRRAPSPEVLPIWEEDPLVLARMRIPLPPPPKDAIKPSPKQPVPIDKTPQPRRRNTEQTEQDEATDIDDMDDPDDSRSIEWSKSPSPRPAHSRPKLQTEKSTSAIPSEVDEGEDDGDMNAEDMVAEEDDYARFMAQIKNRNLDEVRGEIDDEIRVLNNQNKVAMRDSDEITQGMVAQIQTLLRHFGIPYITAPMEAEAQCAKLAELNLVDGIITDDSDVFLFGGKQCFKNIFNDAKYAECFLLSDLDREMSLSRERLISLAYLLGSDYTIGLPGVGPVVALELLANFPGPKGVERFKEWWLRVQRGMDSVEETDTKWKQSFKKRYVQMIYITADWPNPLVAEAYKYPTTDESEEPFHWGFPKLSALRTFLHEELSWSISKVDDELTPIVQRIARRGKGTLPIQTTLLPFFDTSAVQAGHNGNFAPRRRTTANVSKRLMSIIKQFREAEARLRGEEVDGWGVMMADLDEEDPKGKGTGKRRKSTSMSVKIDEEGEGKKEEGEDELVGVKNVKKRRKGRSGTLNSEIGSESVVSTETGDSESLRGKKTRRGSGTVRGRGRGRGRGKGKGKVGSMSMDISGELNGEDV